MAVQRTNIECSCGERLETDDSVTTVRWDSTEIYTVTVTKLVTAEER